MILILFVKLYKQKGKMKRKISNMKGKIQIEVKGLIANHSKSVLDRFHLRHYYFRHVNHSINICFIYTNKKKFKFIKRNIGVLLSCHYRKVLNDIANTNNSCKIY